MKKVTLILCAMLMVLSVNANVRQIRRAANANPQQITLKANQGYLYNWEGTADAERWEGGKTQKGVMRLELGMAQGEGENFQFKKNLIVYFFNKESQTSLNGIYELGIYYANDEQGNPLYLYDNIVDINGNGTDLKAMTGAYLQASVIGVENNMLKYDLYFISNEYEFAVQVPIIGINNVIANENPQADNAFFTPTDQTFFMNESQLDFEYNYSDVELGYDASYNPNLVRVHGYTQGQSYICLDFVVDVLDANSYIPAGTYDVVGSGEVGIVKSAGYLAAEPLPSYALTYDSDGYYNHIWFLSAGTATVEFNGTDMRVTVDAQNAYGKKIKAVIGSLSDTALGETKAEVKADKAIENGQLIIIRNGVRYNAQGAVVE